MRPLLKSAAWLASMIILSLALCLSQMWISTPRTMPTAPAVATASAPPPPAARSVFESSVRTESLGRFPSSHLAYDPEQQGRLYAGGAMSLDGGTTWQPFVDSDGRRAVLLGGARAVAPRPAPDARVVLGEILFEDPAIPSGLGPVAHAVEWRGNHWKILLAAQEDPVPGRPAGEELWPRRAVLGLGQMPDGTPVIVTARALWLGSARSVETPGRIRAALVSTSGMAYVAIADQGRFHLYKAEGAQPPWLPVAGVGAVYALTEGQGQIVYLFGDQGFGRQAGTSWEWTRWPTAPRAEHLAAHPHAPLVAGWGEGKLVLSKDGGRTLLLCRLELAVVWAAWDPFVTDAITVLDIDGNAWRVKLESVR